MKDEQSDKQPIVRISRFSVASTLKGRGRQQREEQHWTVCGVDTNGVEYIYVEHATEEEHEAWRATDPLWREAQAALIGRLLDDTRMRDLAIQINIEAALGAGNAEMAMKLVSYLSPEALHKLMDEDDRAGTDIDPRAHGT